ncbi:MAG: M28 family peptidase [Spirosomaceae bacterium]|nr:M28 family peptidase [Spirosomataceae bacterium]
MIRVIVLITCLVSPFLQAFCQQTSVEYAESILAEDLRRHLTYIASDELEGRDTGSEGQRKAADYIANHFKSLGLTAIVPQKDGSKGYLQKFNLYKNGWQDAYIKIGDGKRLHFKEFFPNGLVNIPAETTSDLLFIENPSDIGANISGKGVLLFESDDKETTKKNAEAAFEAGATTVFSISNADENKFKTLAAERQSVLSRYNRMRLEATENPLQPSKNPSFIVSTSLAADMLGVSERKLMKAKDGKKNLKSSTVTLKSERGDELVETMNVMGFMEGTDKKDEVVVITAHYDHVGIDKNGEIYNGADDDGSGTCGILELAEAFAKAKAAGNGPRRSILFMTVTGEEKGLLGSRYFTDVDPIIPLKQIVCDLNIDMIGRVDKEHADNDQYVYVIGSDKLSSELHAISEKANSDYINFDLDYTFNDPDDPNRFYYRSDHYNFAKNKIPVIFYFTGVHEDYHRPGDDVEKILFPKYQQIVRLVFHTAWDLSNRNDRIVVDSNKK